IGASVTLPDGLQPFAEAPGRAFLVSGPAEALAGLAVIGRVGGDRLRIDGAGRDQRLELAVSELRARRSDGLARYL
ncbi:MAG: hypothetical protein ACRDLV_08475, partial [Solirubrobacteraceae bacterium]